VTRLAAHEDAPHRTLRADAQRGRSALDLRARRVREIGTMAFARMNDQHAEMPGRGEYGAARLDGRREQ
jgi:hypothetical protein